MLDPSSTPTHLGFLWDTSRKTITLPEDKTTWVEAWAKDLMAIKETTQETLECFVGTLVSTVPAVWKGPLHYRGLQIALLCSLKKDRSKLRRISISYQLLRELNRWASGDVRAKRISPWRPPTPTLQIWTDACPYGYGGKSDCGSHFQYAWSEQEKGKHINWLELRTT